MGGIGSGRRPLRRTTALGRLRAARLEAGLSMPAAATTVGELAGVPPISRQRWHQWERSGKVPREWLPHVARALSVSAGYLSIEPSS